MLGHLAAALLAGTLLVAPAVGGATTDDPVDLSDPDVAAVGAAMLFDAAALSWATTASDSLAGADDVGPAWAVWSFSDAFLTGGSFDPDDLKAGAIVPTGHWRAALVADGVPVGTVEAALGPNDAMALSSYDTDADVAAGLTVPGGGHLVLGPRQDEAFFVVDGTVRPLNAAARERFAGAVTLADAQAAFVADGGTGTGSARRPWYDDMWWWLGLSLTGLASSAVILELRRREVR